MLKQISFYYLFLKKHDPMLYVTISNTYHFLTSDGKAIYTALSKDKFRYCLIQGNVRLGFIKQMDH